MQTKSKYRKKKKNIGNLVKCVTKPLGHFHLLQNVKHPQTDADIIVPKQTKQ